MGMKHSRELRQVGGCPFIVCTRGGYEDMAGGVDVSPLRRHTACGTLQTFPLGNNRSRQYLEFGSAPYSTIGLRVGPRDVVNGRIRTATRLSRLKRVVERQNSSLGGLNDPKGRDGFAETR